MLLIVCFLFCFLGILITAYFSIESAKAISNRFRLSDSFMGAVFLAVGTSFPEFVNSIIAGFSDRGLDFPSNAVFSFYNVIGANIWQIVFLVASIALIAFSSIIRKKEQSEIPEICSIFWSHSYLSWKLILIDTIILAFFFSFPLIPALFLYHNFNVLGLFFLAVWIWYIVQTYRQKNSEVSDERSKYFNNFSNFKLISVTFALWILFGSFAYGNFYIVSRFPLNQSTAFGIILSFITSTPEFSVLYFLFRQKEYRMAVGGFFGSSLFNLVLPVITNSISLNPIIGNTHENFYGIRNWLILNVILIILFLFTFLKRKNPEFPAFINGIVVFLIYLFSNLFFSF